MDLPTLRDGDLVLRSPRAGDAAAIAAACQDPEIARWTNVPSPYSRADAERYIASSAADAEAGRAACLLAILSPSGGLLGSFSVMELDRAPGYGEVGYWVAAAARGRGVATRCTRMLVDWARRELRLTRIEILPHHENDASRRVAEKAGFHDTGELRAAPRSGTGEADFAVYTWSAP